MAELVLPSKCLQIFLLPYCSGYLNASTCEICAYTPNSFKMTFKAYDKK